MEASVRCRRLACLAMLIVPWSVMAASPPTPYYSVQIASANSESAARAILDNLRDAPAARVELRGGQYAVRVGAWPQREAAVQALEQHRAGGWNNAFVLHIQNAVAWIEAGSPPAVAVAPPAPSPPEATAAADDAPLDAAGRVERSRRRHEPLVEATGLPMADADAADGIDFERWWKQAQVRIEDLGWHDGFVLEGATGTRDLYLPVPPGVAAHDARVTLNIQYGDSLIDESTMLVSVNGAPRRTLRRASAGPAGATRIELPLTARDLRREFVHVRFEYTQLADRDVCFSETLAGAWTRVEPDSGLTLVAGDLPPATVRAAWAVLPREVVVAADFASLDADEFEALFRLVSRLRAEGREYRLRPLLPATQLKDVRAHIVLAEPGALAERAVVDAVAMRGNLHIVQEGRRTLLVLQRGRAAAAVAATSRSWRAASAESAADGSGTGTVRARGRDHLRLSDLGFGEGERRFNRATRWDIPLPFGAMGPAMRPDWVQLQIYAPDVSGTKPTVLSAYYNDRLVYSGTLARSNQAQSVEFALPRHLLRARNQLSLVAQRDQEPGPCGAIASAQAISISPSSRIQLKPYNDLPETFAELVPYETSLRIYLPDSALNAAQHIIPFLVAAGGNFWPSAAPPEIRFFSAEQSFVPDGPFLVVGQPKWEAQAPVLFDQGRARILTAATGAEFAVLEAQPSADWALLQMAQANGHAGVWVVAPGGYQHLPSQRLQLEDEDVALLDTTGVQMALRVGPTRDYDVTYPDADNWFAAAGRMRVLLFVAAWLTIATVIVYLLRASRRHRGSVPPKS